MTDVNGLLRCGEPNLRTRADELAMTNWTPEQCEAFIRMQFIAQSTHYAQRYPQGQHLIILVGATPVGCLYVARQEERLHILDITVLPEYGRRGTGTAVLKSLLDEARQTAKAVSIYVENFNPSLRLFERLGFTKVEEEGFNYLMECKPDA